jgi:hypothetical protein
MFVPHNIRIVEPLTDSEKHFSTPPANEVTYVSRFGTSVVIRGCGDTLRKKLEEIMKRRTANHFKRNS